MDDTKPCPVCGETIKAVALKCRFCNTDLAAFEVAKTLEVEKDIFVGRPSPFYSATQVLPFIVLIPAAIVLAKQTDDIGQALGFFVLASCALTAYYYLKSLSSHYRISTQRIKVEYGLLSKKQESLELFRIDHFEIHKPLGMRLLGQSELHLFSSDLEFENFKIYGLANLDDMADILRECQLRERKRRGLSTFVRA